MGDGSHLARSLAHSGLLLRFLFCWNYLKTTKGLHLFGIGRFSKLRREKKWNYFFKGAKNVFKIVGFFGGQDWSQTCSMFQVATRLVLLDQTYAAPASIFNQMIYLISLGFF